MLKAYTVCPGEKILLVGEGNFSFSKDFVIFNEKILLNKLSKTEVVTTCKESHSETLTELKQLCVKYLCEKGITVIFNVDATNLKCHEALTKHKYSKVIFNFPHVGGKMKIHLNRTLLKDFFSSACDVLDVGGSVVVALCDGQGGTDADKKKRRWDDSWQITEMAAQSDFVLYHVEPFDVEYFPHYVNVGFRSWDKSFHCENAVVHVFKKQVLPRILQDDPDRWTKAENAEEDLIFEFLDQNLVNPFSNPHSASSFVFENIKEKLGPNYCVHKSVLKYYSCPNSSERIMLDLYSTIQMEPTLDNILHIFTTLKQENYSNENMIVKVLMKSRPINLGKFCVPPVKCQMIIFGGETSSSMLLTHLSHMLMLFNFEWFLSIVQVEDKICKNRIVFNDPNSELYHNLSIVESLVLPDGTTCHIIQVDGLAQILFKLSDWRSLWDGRVQSSPSTYPTFHPTVLFPRAYSFDLSLSVPLDTKEQFEERFFLILWLLAGDMIIKVELLSTYLPSDRALICYCYRITYRSYNAPIYRKRVIQIHEQLITEFVSRSLQVNVT